ncbi:hypothetical protein GGS26DRAFT_588244 [Hypomontagnella submonticulosa]|nr:hypothetical protein GGS26DRAFT_588244 [Hypomontagnella submonticulosa]
MAQRHFPHVLGRNKWRAHTTKLCCLPPIPSRWVNDVFSQLIGRVGQDEEAPGTDRIKAPLGIIDFVLTGHVKSDITWNMTGTLGGESYRATKAPCFPSDKASTNPYHLIRTGAHLDLPAGYNVPMSFVFANATVGANYRVQPFVNGWQFGKYVARKF